MGELTCKGTWSPLESKLHINVLEMRAVKLALLHFNLQALSIVLVSTDNTTVVAYINKEGGTRSTSLWDETQELFQVVMSHQWTLKAVHIPGRLNVIADLLSRDNQILPTEWSLHPAVVKALFDLWGRPHVDLFATRLNHKLEIFVSPMPDPQAWAVDALSLSWRGLWAYAFPPHQIMAKVLHHLRESQCELILIAPAWPRQPWFADLLELSVETQRELPLWDKLLKQPTGTRFHLDPSMLHLHAWRLSSRGSETPASPRTQLPAYPLRSLSPLTSSMKESGKLSCPGVETEALWRSLPLFHR